MQGLVTRVLASVGLSPEDVAGVTEIAQILRVNRRTAARYVELASFPAPVGTLSRGRVWLRADVDRWGKEHLPLAVGRPKKDSS
jgi:prophage regulatory protein